MGPGRVDRRRSLRNRPPAPDVTEGRPAAGNERSRKVHQFQTAYVDVCYATADGVQPVGPDSGAELAECGDTSNERSWTLPRAGRWICQRRRCLNNGVRQAVGRIGELENAWLALVSESRSLAQGGRS